MRHAFEIENATKSFGSTTALDAVSVSVPRQSIVGLVGRNGSGKTTLLRLVTGLLLPDSGRCATLGTDTARLGAGELSRIGVVNQHDTLLEWMRAEQLVRYVSTFYGSWDRDLERALMAELEVDGRARVGAMSPGNLQKLSLVLATCHHPELLLLDEPLSDLDPIARQSVLSMLLDRFRSEEMTIVVSSHMLRDIEPALDRVIILESGRVAAQGELDELKDQYADNLEGIFSRLASRSHGAAPARAVAGGRAR
jgi:ABC-2 type transport system ATP-binding protein